MKSFIRKMLSDSTGTPSLMRVLSGLSFIVAVVLAFVHPDKIALVGIFSASAFGGKSIQSFAENRVK